MTTRLPQLRETVANAITYHPGNRTGTPEQRHPVSLMLADAVLRVVRPCTCDADPIECSHETARAEAEETLAEVRRLCELTIACSCRAHAIEQAEDTLRILNRHATKGTDRT